MSASTQSKAAKKNQKRAEKRAKERAQKLKEDGVIDRLIHDKEDVVEKIEDPVEKLKTQLQEAKDKKDHKLAAKLRKDLWIMQDQMAGYAPPEEIIEHSQAGTNEEDSGNIECQTTQEQLEKKLRGLKKKIQQIEKLKSKQDEGEYVIAKIQSEEAICKEIEELKERLEKITASLEDTSNTSSAFPHRYFQVPLEYWHSEDLRGRWLAHFAGERIAREIEVLPSGEKLFFDVRENYVEMCHLSLTETNLTKDPQKFEITKEEFESIWMERGEK